MNTNKMKAVLANMALVATMSLVSLTVPTNAIAAQNSERMCLLFGVMAQEVAVSRSLGITEEKTIEGATSALKKNEKATANMTSIVQYVYTTGYDPKTARNLVYLKCRAREYQ